MKNNEEVTENSKNNKSTYLDVGLLVESIHLVEQLQQNALHLPVRTRLRVETLRSDGIYAYTQRRRGLCVRQEC